MIAHKDYNLMKKNYFLLSLLLFVFAFAKAQTTVTTSYQADDDKIVTVNFEQPAAITIDELVPNEGNVTILGGNDGYFTVRITGGNPNTSAVVPYNIILKKNNAEYNGATVDGTSGSGFYDVNFSNLIAGTGTDSYSVEVSNPNGSCTEILTNIEITEPPVFEFNDAFKVVNQPNCNGDTGTIKVRAQGGIADYNYQLLKETTPGSDSYINEGSPMTLNPATDYTSPNLNPGNYKVQVRDDNGSGSATILSSVFTINNIAPVTFTLNTKTDVSCKGGNNGAISINVSGGDETYTFNWTKADSTFTSTQQNLTNLTAGTYTLYVEDSNNCPDNVSDLDRIIVIGEPTDDLAITLETSGIQNPTGVGLSDGFIKVDVAGGTESQNTNPYTYSWTLNSVEVGVDEDLIDVEDGDYTLTVTDVNGCTATFTETLTDPQPVVAIVDITTPIDCNGDSGTLEASGSGGSGSYTYEWFIFNGSSFVDTGVTTATYTNAVPGEYKVQVTDAFGINDSTSITLSEPPLITLSNPTIKNVSCFDGANGSIEISASGGTGSLSYEWRLQGATPIIATTSDIFNLAAGNYILTVRDGNMCSITVDTPIAITQPASALSITNFTETDILINGEDTGSIDITVSGGTPGYTFSWTKDGDASFNSVTEDISGLTAGTYTIIVTDGQYYTGSGNEGCTTTQTFTLTEPSFLDIEIAVNTEIDCNGNLSGSLDAIATGGTPSYNYQWKELISGTFVDVANSTATTSQLQNVGAGEYEVTVTDGNGASNTDSYIFIEPTLITISNIVIQDVACFGEDTGSITLNVSEGTGPYTYEWRDDLNNVVGNTKNLLDVTTGTYTLTVTDFNGCTISSSALSIEQPNAPLLITEESKVDLTGFETNNGSIDISVSGGTTGYSFLWSKDGDVTFTAITEDLDALSAGTYNVLVTDSNNCTMTDSFTLTEPDLLIIESIDQANLNLCFGDSTTDITSVVSGGIPPYNYSWYLNSEPGDVLSTVDNLMNRPAGTYALNIIDANGIETSSNNIVVTAPSKIVVSEIHTDVLCKGEFTGEIDITVTGGTPKTTGAPYFYAWSNGATSEDISGIPAGEYSVTVTDSNTCQSEEVFITISEPVNSLSISDSTITGVTGSGLSNGSVSVVVSGGTPAYEYTWTNSTGSVISNTNEITNQIAGIYTLMVTDANGCTIAPTDFEIEEPTLLTVAINDIDITCNGGTGSLEAVVNGGIAPYTYSWIDESGTEISTAINSGIIASGIYDLTVYDVNNNSASIIGYFFSQPDAISLSSQLTHVSCHNAANGAIELLITSGSNNYDISWDYDTNNISQSALGLTGGTYVVTIVDQLDASCTLSETFIIDEPGAYGINNNIVQMPSVSDNDGSISLSVFGGVAPFTYEWVNQDGTLISTITEGANHQINNLAAGIYTVTVTDSSGASCIVNETYIVGLPATLITEINQSGTITCATDTVTLNVNTTSTYTHQWFDAITDTAIANETGASITVGGGSYYVRVIDNVRDLTEISTATIVIEPAAVQASVVATNALCFEDANGSIVINANGGSDSYQYIYRLVGQSYPTTWADFENGASTTITGLTQGDYEIRVRDNLGCTYNNNGNVINIPVTISEPQILIIDSETIVNTTGNGLNNGSVSVTITGGTSPYTYLWTNSSGITVASDIATINDLLADTYTLNVTDANGCTIDPTEFMVTEPAALGAEIIETDITCNGGEGSIEAIASGGTPDYIYLWTDSNNDVVSNSSNTGSITAGIYNLLIKDAFDNELSRVIEFTEPDPLALSEIITDVSCYNDSNGAIELSITGGSGTYDISWDYSQTNTTTIASGLSGGTYTVTIKDGIDSNCILTETFTIEEPEPYGLNNIMVTTPSSTNNDGTVSLNVFGGTAPFTFDWVDESGNAVTSTTANSTNSISGLAEGDYTLTVTDSSPFNCQLINTFTLGLPGELLVAVDQTREVTCYGGNDGQITVTTNTGVNTYAWYDASVTPAVLITGLDTPIVQVAAGTYYVEVYDAVQSITELSAPIIISQPDAVQASVTTTDVVCFEESNGAFIINAIGGSGSYEYVYRAVGENYPTDWIDFDNNTATTINNLSHGNYQVRVRDNTLCTFNNSNGTITDIDVVITQPNELLISDTTITNTTGNGLVNGNITVAISGGTSPYTYLWTDSSGTVIDSDISIIDGIAAGNYTLNVTDASGCTIEPTNFIVTEPNILSVEIIESDITCYGGEGSLEAIVSGGTPEFTYSWTDANNNEISSTANSGNVMAGVYNLLITDSFNNQLSEVINFVQPEALALSEIITDVSCYNEGNGSIELSITGGSGTYDVTWDYNPTNTTTIASGLSGGTYTVTIKDQIDMSCELVESFVVNEPLPYGISNSVVQMPSPEGNDGSISLGIFGGVAPFTYNWIDQSGINVATVIEGANHELNNLSAGIYTVTATDSSGASCEVSETFIVGLPATLISDISQTGVITCTDDTIILNVVTTNTYNYQWFNAITNSVITGETSSSINVGAGSYYIMVTDAGRDLVEISAPITIVEPDAIQVSASTTDALCFNDVNGTIIINATGGSGSYQYIYRRVGQVYPTTWTDFDDNDSTIITDISQGDYEIRVRDNLGCTYNSNGSIINTPVTVSQPNELVISDSTIINTTGNGLSNGSVSVIISGGTLDYTYQWSNASGQIVSTIDTIDDVTAGIYTLTVTDANGCTIIPTDFEVLEPQPLILDTNITAIILCNGDASGSISVIATGGVPFSNSANDYNFEWFDNTTMALVGTDPSVDDLIAGSYYVVVTDANNNVAVSDVIEISEPDALSLTLEADFVLCGDQNDWEIISTVTGGIPGYNYIWSNGDISPNLTNVLPGEYTLSISDQYGCVTSNTITLVPPPTLTANATTVNTTCFDGDDGSIQLAPAGGSPPYTYIWDNGGSSNTTNNLVAGIYQVSIIDSKGCEIIETYEITEPAETILNLGPDTTLCLDQTVELDATIANGLSYSWTSDNGFTSSDPQVVLSEEGTYTVIATNTSGCIVTDEISVLTVEEPINAEFLVSTQAFIDQPFVIVQVSDPFPDTVEWILPEDANVLEMGTDYVELSFSATGEYDLTLKVTNGNCTEYQTKRIIIIEGQEFDVELESNDDPTVKSFLIYPNPTSGEFTLDVELKEVMPLSVKVFGLSNNVPVDQRYLDNQDTYQETYNLSVASGVYFILLETPNNTVLKKLIIQ
tara:strand:- start:15123 stop:24740 length:9618 start_codon:yes stop_codon:yes gene_type:complete